MNRLLLAVDKFTFDPGRTDKEYPKGAPIIGKYYTSKGTAPDNSEPAIEGKFRIIGDRILGFSESRFKTIAKDESDT